MLIRYCSVYFVRGGSPKTSEHRYEISDPPSSGEARAFILRREADSKVATIFSPFTLEAYQVSRNAAEVLGAKDVEMDRAELSALIRRSWDVFQKLGLQRAYDVAAQVLTLIGGDVPTDLSAAPQDRQVSERKKGGKPAEPERFKPVKPGKRGDVAAILKDGGVVSLLEVMARLDMNRNTLLTHLHRLHAEHGLGYELSGDSVRLLVPEGVSL